VLLAASSLALRQALERSAWAGVARTDLAAEFGYHEALGAVGLARACELLAADVASVLLLSGTAATYQGLLLEQTAAAEG
jgi:hypothetical protein